MADTPLIAVTDSAFRDNREEAAVARQAGYRLAVYQCADEAALLREIPSDTAVLLNQFAPVTRTVIERLPHCRAIVRYGIGVDTIDRQACREKGIAVCNVPDYGSVEVAEHALSLALALARRLPQMDGQVRAGRWLIEPDGPVSAFADLTFGTAGFGRIARSLHERLGVLGFRRLAYDPFVGEAAYAEAGVQPVSRETLLAEADILSLHLPLTEDTRHLVDATALEAMKPSAILINTARGGLIDTRALADALSRGTVGAAGLDVFETEPLEPDHPIRSAPNCLLTSHNAWYSTASQPRLQRLAAEEAVRAIRGEPLRSPVA
ncbi:MAG: C-terminal binding protein [Opitutales bacterium]